MAAGAEDEQAEMHLALQRPALRAQPARRQGEAVVEQHALQHRNARRIALPALRRGGDRLGVEAAGIVATLGAVVGPAEIAIIEVGQSLAVGEVRRGSGNGGHGTEHGQQQRQEEGGTHDAGTILRPVHVRSCTRGREGPQSTRDQAQRSFWPMPSFSPFPIMAWARAMSESDRPRCQKMMVSRSFSRPGFNPATIWPISACSVCSLSLPALTWAHRAAERPALALAPVVDHQLPGRCRSATARPRSWCRKAR